MSPGAGTRERILEATLRCFEQQGMSATSLEDVARGAGLSRATLYRTFPGGREEVVSETVRWEIGNFLEQLGSAVAEDRGLETKLVHALGTGHRALVEHRLLHQILSTEPELLFRELIDTEPLVLATIRDYIARELEGESVRPGVDPDEAADYLARLLMSYLGTSGAWDLDDPAVVGELVRTQFLAGVLA